MMVDIQEEIFFENYLLFQLVTAEEIRDFMWRFLRSPKFSSIVSLAVEPPKGSSSLIVACRTPLQRF